LVLLLISFILLSWGVVVSELNPEDDDEDQEEAAALPAVRASSSKKRSYSKLD
jgi:hypothetical protein